MNTTRKHLIPIAMAAITVATLAIVGCQADTSSKPDTHTTQVGPSVAPDPGPACETLAGLPGYTVTFEDGSKVDEPSGFDRADEAGWNERACVAMVRQQRSDQR